MDDDDDDVPQLPADTLQLMKNFKSEREAAEKQFEDMKTQSENAFDSRSGKLSMELFGEDWNASQFWYTDATAQILARALLEGAKEDSAIAVVSAPSVYIQLRNILDEEPISPRPKLCLLEYDKRFAVVGSDFIHYDYNFPLKLSAELKNRFDRIICDPPFLSEECQVKTALTARFLAQDWIPNGNTNVLICTGERMETTVTKVYGKAGVRTTTFEPEHSRGLSNEFRAYANFPSARWKYR